jgi:hypothetical protein
MQVGYVPKAFFYVFVSQRNGSLILVSVGGSQGGVAAQEGVHFWVLDLSEGEKQLIKRERYGNTDAALEKWAAGKISEQKSKGVEPSSAEQHIAAAMEGEFNPKTMFLVCQHLPMHVHCNCSPVKHKRQSCLTNLQMPAKKPPCQLLSSEFERGCTLS